MSPLIGENVTCGAIEKLHCFVDTPKIVLAWHGNKISGIALHISQPHNNFHIFDEISFLLTP